MPTPSIWTYQDNFDFRKDIDQSSPFFVELEGVRGDYSRNAILKEFLLDAAGEALPGVKPKTMATVLFGGHVGSGKSTELRKLTTLFEKTYTVSHLEITKILDINNLRFSDLLIALAERVVTALIGNALAPDPVFVKPVTEWFETRILSEARFKDLEAEVKTEAAAGLTLPFLAKILATFTGKVRNGASYREDLRKEVRDGFTALANGLNALIAHANDLLEVKGKGPLLFIVDGTDKLKREDSEGFFQTDVNQLGQIQTNFILCAPISVLLEVGGTAQRFPRLRLPMVKIYDRTEREFCPAVDALTQLVAKRLPLAYFDNEETVKYLVSMSGGHPRDLLRLVRGCFSKIDAAPITRAVAETAVRDMAAEYQRSVLQQDWADIVKVDLAQGEDTDRTDSRLRMLYDLILLEYNNYWWRSHPLVREIAGYRKAKDVAQKERAQKGSAGSLPLISPGSA